MNLDALTQERAQIMGQMPGTPSHVHDAIGLATSWLKGEETAWFDQQPTHSTAFINERMEKQGTPATLGFSSRYSQDLSTIAFMSPYISPAQERQQVGVASTAPAFGPLGTQRMAGLHELGHDMENRMGLHTARSELERSHHAECRADGFAIAWAVAQGADPKGCVRDAALSRAGTVVHQDTIQADYFVFPVLDAAAQVGMQHRGAPADPVAIMKDVHAAVLQHALSKPELDMLNGMDLSTLRSVKELRGYQAPITEALKAQTPWTQEQEATWWAKLVTHNPVEAPVLSRMPVAMQLAKATRDPDMISESPASVEWFAKLAPAAGTPERAEQIRALAPKDPTPDSIADSLNKAAELFNGPLDRRIQKDLRTVAEATRMCEDVERTTTRVPGMAGDAKAFVLVDDRGAGLSNAAIQAISRKIQGGHVSVIAVVSEDEEQAKALGERLRRQGDAMKARVYGLDEETWDAKRPQIQGLQAEGKVWAVGALPEMRRTKARELA